MHDASPNHEVVAASREGAGETELAQPSYQLSAGDGR